MSTACTRFVDILAPTLPFTYQVADIGWTVESEPLQPGPLYPETLS